ncbi:hypothetical protein TNCV_2440531 [Trichonephila clavipes]|nr:hypothetical protein TNCV_2440531 [Trichonephila clavipes]
MPRVRSKNAYQHVSDFDKGRIVAYWSCSLSYCNIAARVGRDSMTQPRRQACYLQGNNGSCGHVTFSESGIGVVCKKTSVYMKSSTMFAAAWTLSLKTMVVATIDAASQTGESSTV